MRLKKSILIMIVIIFIISISGVMSPRISDYLSYKFSKTDRMIEKDSISEFTEIPEHLSYLFSKTCRMLKKESASDSLSSVSFQIICYPSEEKESDLTDIPDYFYNLDSLKQKGLPYEFFDAVKKYGQPYSIECYYYETGNESFISRDYILNNKEYFNVQYFYCRDVESKLKKSFFNLILVCEWNVEIKNDIILIAFYEFIAPFKFVILDAYQTNSWAIRYE